MINFVIGIYVGVIITIIVIIHYNKKAKIEYQNLEALLWKLAMENPDVEAIIHKSESYYTLSKKINKSKTLLKRLNELADEGHICRIRREND